MIDAKIITIMLITTEKKKNNISNTRSFHSLIVNEDNGKETRF